MFGQNFLRENPQRCSIQYPSECMKCKTSLTEQERIIQCKKCSSYNELIPCPKCQKGIAFCNESMTGLPYPGARIQCPSCTTEFQTVCCPHCKISNFWLKNLIFGFPFKLGNLSKCFSCKKDFSTLVCPYCLKAEFQEKFDETEKIECKGCNESYFLSNCPYCNSSNFDDKYKHSKNCSNCSKSFIRISCPSCKLTTFGSNNIELGNIINCQKCFTRYKYIKSPCCDTLHEIKPNQSEDLCQKLSCLGCAKSFKLYHCPECLGSSCCACGEAAHSSEFNKCSLCSKVYRSEEERNKDYQCKICFFDFIDGIFEGCSHACCCFKCYSKMTTSSCPICRIMTNFKKFKLN